MPCYVVFHFDEMVSKFEVRTREGGAVTIHMFCPRKPGLLLSTVIRSIENLGCDVQQAVISCFNGFSLDLFKDEVMYNCSHLLPATFIHTDHAQGIAGGLAVGAQGDQVLVGSTIGAVERQDVVLMVRYRPGLVSEGFGNKS
ncbi:hypothetical protein EJB05_27041, partial [Eragrostis curvula]